MRLLLSFIILLYSTNAIASYFKHIGMSDGLSHLSVRGFYQDKTNRIWIGTHEGISIFDGARLLNYKPLRNNDPSKPDENNTFIGNLVYQITGDKNGDIFILVNNKLVKYEFNKEIFSTIFTTNVHTIYSNQENIWCVKNDSIFKYENNRKEFIFQIKTSLTNINSLLVIDNTFYLGTSNGLYAIKKNKNTNTLCPYHINSLYQDKNKRIWIGTRYDGCFYFTPTPRPNIKRLKLATPSKESNDIRCFTEDKQGYIWIGSFDGLYQINQSNFKSTFYNSPELGHSSIYSLFTDQDGTIWIGSYYGGVNYLTEKSRGIKKYNYNPYRTNSNTLEFPFIGNMVEDKRGNLWICLDGGGLACLNRETGTFQHYQASPSGLPHNNLKTICYDARKDVLYIGTHKGGLSRFDIQSNKFYNFPNKKKKNSPNFPNNIIDQIQIWNDSLIVSARNGLFIINGQNGEGRKLTKYVLLHFDIDSLGILWGINTKHFVTMDLRKQGNLRKIPTEYANEAILSQIINVNHKVYISTLGRGLIVYDTINKNFTYLNKDKNNILSNYCYNISSTHDGKILCSTDKGIFLYNPKSQKFYNIESSSLFSKGSIVAGCGIYACKNNELFIGSTNGMVSLTENKICKPYKQIKTYFQQLFVNNELIKPGDSTGILSGSLPTIKKISLPYNKNNIVITFSTSDIGKQNNILSYEYYLQGFDQNWTTTDKFEIKYTNLPPGNYTLKIRIRKSLTEPKDTQVFSENSLDIEVKNVWYATLWAKSLLIIVLAGGIFWNYRIKETKRKITLSLEKERLEKKHIEELNQAKLHFFTNISHEFKTPLTLISTQLEILQQAPQLTPTTRSQLSKIARYTKQLHELISELLDFRKIEQKKMKIELSNQDISVFLTKTFDCFSEYAKQHHINYTLQNELPSPTTVWFDGKQMQKVISNLLSNAFKFTPDGGCISLETTNVNEIIRIKISDTGIGISDSDLPYIFNRFYQSSQKPYEKTTGTGIGLALSKSIVELHHGTIKVSSKIGDGSCFIIELPTNKSVYDNDQNLEWKQQPIASNIDTTIPEEDLTYNSSWINLDGNYQSKKILIVEDNIDLRLLLQQLFSPLYNVILASDGTEGLLYAHKENPDLILSDIMMPNMSGIEMCNKIKSSLDLCHIPVVLLTALDSIENNIEGLNVGADDYVTKPFDTKLLLTRCNNIIRNRQLIQEKFAKKQDCQISMIATNALDKKFLDDIVRIIDSNLDNVDFDIPLLCQELGMSRSSFQRKFKSLTNMTPNDFIIQHKLKIAANILVQDPNLQIGEIADKLGFGSSKYFSRLFKEFFNYSPFEYRKNNLNETHSK